MNVKTPGQWKTRMPMRVMTAATTIAGIGSRKP